MRNQLAFALVLAMAGSALADTTLTWLSSNAKVDRVNLTVSGTQIFADICGSVLGSDGVTVRASCQHVELLGASKTAVQSWMNGAGLTAWKTGDGV